MHGTWADGEVGLETGELFCHVLKGQPQNSWKISMVESINIVRCSSPARMQSPLFDPWQRVSLLILLECLLTRHILRRHPVPSCVMVLYQLCTFPTSITLSPYASGVVKWLRLEEVIIEKLIIAR